MSGVILDEFKVSDGDEIDDIFKNGEAETISQQIIDGDLNLFNEILGLYVIETNNTMQINCNEKPSSCYFEDELL